MIKKCIICGKQFESFNKSSNHHVVTSRKCYRPHRAKTCSKECSRKYLHVYRNPNFQPHK